MFKDNPTINFMLSTELRGKAPPEFDWRRFYSSFKLAQGSPHDLAAAVYTGFAFTPVYKNRRRKEENFHEAYHLAFDLDTQDERSSLDFIMRPGTFSWMFCSFAYSTPSSTPDKPKSRVVFIFQQPVTSAEAMREIYAAVAWRLHDDGLVTDKQCGDPLRLYYGSPGCDVIGNWSLLADDALAYLITEYYEANPPTPPRKLVDAAPVYKTADEHVMHIINRTVDNLRGAMVGERHTKRRDIGRAVGGYVAAGYLSKSDALNMLMDAAPGDSRAEIEKEINEAVEYGMKEPLYIERELTLGEVLNV